MFTLKNGILYRDNRPVFALGLSYYPSYHPQKVPVPPEGDREGEMAQDISEMVDAGFNVVRMAALGEVRREAGSVKVDFPFIDRLIARAENAGLASMVRLQGYGVNLSGFTDNLMLNQRGEEMPFHWGWFVRNCLNHAGILKDNEEATRVSAAHFKRFPSVVSFQIYNEPAYPAIDYYDYNPHSIRAWREWLAERGYTPASEAATLDAPRKRPVFEAERSLWMRWRLFHYERMNDFLNRLSDIAKESHPVPETLTCHMAWPANAGSTMRGEDYFRVAEKMDIVGITHYIPAIGTSHYYASEVLDMAESAAACYGKHAWLIEYNARTDMSANEWERETYSAVGSGFKGILYYQWRADYPYADGPEPEGFGMVFNNRRKTEKFDRAVAMNGTMNLLGADFARAEKLRSGVAVLFSENVNAYYDALDNGDENDVARNRERSAFWMRAIYADFRKNAVSVDFVRAGELAANPLGVRLLLVPSLAGLVAEEKQAIDAFAASGGRVFVYQPDTFGYAALSDNVPRPDKVVPLAAESVLDSCGIGRAYRCDKATLDVKVLKGGGRCIVCLVNFDPAEKPIDAGENLTLFLSDAAEYRAARLYEPKKETELAIRKQGPGALSLTLPELGMGAFIVLTGEKNEH
ncbi:MAG: alpha-amylase family protein [Treponemataceae bacterium]